MYKVLVVDDIPIIRESIACQVDESEYMVKAAGTTENGVQSLEWLERYYADICITDIKMPFMNGLELISEIRTKYPWMICFVISSYDDFCYAMESIKLEAVDYVLKPVDDQKLNEALKKSVDKLERQRLDQAKSFLMAHVLEWDAMMISWKDAFSLEQENYSHILLNKTVSMVSGWINNKSYLLESLATAWIQLVCAELKVHDNCGWFGSGEKFISIEEGNIEVQERETYFTNRCYLRLQLGMNYIKSIYSITKEIPQSKLIDKLKKYIGENYTRNEISLQELADYIAFSKNYLSNIFKQYTGVTVWNYIINLRMEKAKELLSESSKKSGEIAMEVGYSDYIHFSRLFKETYGISPQEYRNKIQG